MDEHKIIINALEHNGYLTVNSARRHNSPTYARLTTYVNLWLAHGGVTNPRNPRPFTLEGFAKFNAEENEFERVW